MLAAITLGDFLILHNVTPTCLSAPVTYGIYTEGPVTVVNGIYIYANSTFDRPVSATTCKPIKLGKFYVLTPQGVVVVGQGGGSCRYLAFISSDKIEVYGIPYAGRQTPYRNDFYWLPFLALILLLPLLYMYQK
jgi:hypothetical protein